MQPPLFQPRLPWLIIAGFSILAAICCLVPLGILASLLIATGAVVIAGFLYFRYPLLYLGFVWWVWILAPLVRRMVDLKSGFIGHSPILLTPLLVSAFTAITLHKNIAKLPRLGGLPFIFAIASVTYGVCIGVIQATSVPNIIETGLEFVIPLLLGFHIYINWPYYPAIKHNLQRCFYWGTLVMGLYGIFQFLVAPAWDQAWLINVTSDNVVDIGSTFGIPEPLGIRVWSTLNSPLDFAVVIAAGLLSSLTLNHTLQIPIFGIGFLALLLSQIRTVWLSFFAAMVFVIISLKSNLQIRLLALLFIIVLSIIPLTVIEPFSTAISDRVETLTNVENDFSGNERQETYDILLVPALTSYIGYGTGNIPNFNRVLDSSLLSVLFSLGLFGSIIYFGSWLSLLARAISSTYIKADPFAVAARAFSISMLPAMMLGPIMWNVSGTVIWSFVGVAAAAAKYYASSSAHPSNFNTPINQPVNQAKQIISLKN